MDQPKTMTVPDAGRVYFSLGRNSSYEAARRGDIPTIRIGRLLRVRWRWSESWRRRGDEALSLHRSQEPSRHFH